MTAIQTETITDDVTCQYVDREPESDELTTNTANCCDRTDMSSYLGIVESEIDSNFPNLKNINEFDLRHEMRNRIKCEGIDSHRIHSSNNRCGRKFQI